MDKNIKPLDAGRQEPCLVNGVKEFGLSRKERLGSRREFLEAYEKGERVLGACLVFYLIKNNLQYHRLGVTVSRKIGGSVVRNRVKRSLREIFRSSKTILPPHYDLVVNAKKKAAQVSHKELQGDFLAAIKCWDQSRQK